MPATPSHPAAAGDKPRLHAQPAQSTRGVVVHALRCYIDPISPYAALAFEQLPEALEGLSVQVDHVPILFAALLKAHGHKGPAEIPGKRAWTYRHVLWEAQRLGVPLALPATHPFNPLPLLRLAWACAPAGLTPNRWVIERILRHVWQGGHDAVDPVRMAALRDELAPAHDPDSEVVKQRLRSATEHAQRTGLFGVPSFEVGGRLFWGLESLPMLSAFLRGQAWFDGPAWHDAQDWPVGAQRR